MNIKTLTAFFVLFLFAGAISTSAQAREITEEEYKKVENEAYDRIHSGAWRSKMASHYYKNGDTKNPVRVFTEELETAANGDVRSITVTKTKDGIKKKEVIKIGHEEFVSENNGDWGKIDKTKEFEPIFGVTGDEVPRTTKTSKYRYLEKVELNGQLTDVYESSRFRHYKFSDGREIKYTIIEKIWINKDGKFLKREMHTDHDDNSQNVKTVWIYNFSQSIKIEAPIK